MSNAELLKEVFGLDTGKLASQDLEQPDYPDTVPGRVLHIDGDLLAYQVSYDDSTTLETMIHNFDVAAETLKLLAGAESVVHHLTDSAGDKGNRFNIAIQQEYQACRKGVDKPKNLARIKEWMVMDRGAISHKDQEADDGLCQANVAAIDAGHSHLSVLTSRDKDLTMCPGLQLNWETGDIEEVSGYGYVNLDRSKSVPKIRGKGTSYFWAQMLTGDSADSIVGTPTVCGTVMNIVKPTAPITKAVEVLKNPKSTDKQKMSARKKLDARKPSKCGPVLAHAIMEQIPTDSSAFKVVKMLYQKHGETTGFKHWKTGKDVPWQKVFISDAKLLWMRRYKDENDVLQFFKECCT